MLSIIVDYGLGNLWSVKNALDYIGIDVVISGDPDQISNADFIILPGVGSFGSGMDNLHSRDLVEVLNHRVINKGVLTLGICLGMQLLSDESEESKGVKGLGWIPGKIIKFNNKSLRLPHMGFNSLIAKNTSVPFLNNIRDTSDFYFVHSYYFSAFDKNHIIAWTRYGIDFASIVRKDNIIGFQFHPEKSQSNGIQLLKDVIKSTLLY